MHFIFNNLGWQLIANNNTLMKSTCPTTTIKKKELLSYQVSSFLNSSSP